MEASEVNKLAGAIQEAKNLLDMVRETKKHQAAVEKALECKEGIWLDIAGHQKISLVKVGYRSEVAECYRRQLSLMADAVVVEFEEKLRRWNLQEAIKDEPGNEPEACTE